MSAAIYKHLRDVKDYGFRDQITRAGLSSPSNIAEGFERETQKLCLAFLSYAKGSCGELRSQIYIGIEIGYIEKTTGEKWIRKAKEIASIRSALIKEKGFINTNKKGC